MARLKRVKRGQGQLVFSLPSSGPLSPNFVVGSIGGFCDYCDKFHYQMEQSFVCMECFWVTSTNRFLRVDSVYMGVVTCYVCKRVFYPVVESFPKGFRFIPD